ncbi:TIGR03086 family protein [Blastococcus sp. CT_GayMR20]|uniref:TIGR03086 family metal-binding protein n=1 Tax=Blastococcus sp. CT_GayMR20 TaxID=2559609 RepID=UPI0010746F0B|nr:TIGR03086 family metal-binding protein [Blastococcus sp. CT_GayMR20]TFV67667.1 TIGR03086 family protein [Blastococcus sp. CT_GayMR20]TFV67674.1 TIGR03086 family protein [Blastococcus sp. CT_GayMR20]
MADFSPVELLELFQRAQAQFTDRVDAVEPGQWDDESLPGWTVADLVAHLVNEQLWVPPLLAGEPYDLIEGRFPDGTEDLLGDDPFTGWETAADGALSAFAEDDALVRTVHLSRGPTPATEYIFEMTADLTVHSWDLARATDGDTELDGELVTAALVYAESLPADGIPGIVDPPLDVPPSALPQVRLLARFGRRATSSGLR